jgi:hypothetical protein
MRNYAMSTSRLADCNRALKDDSDDQDAGDSQFLIRALRELIERLAESGVGPVGGEDADPEEVESWEGGGYVYLESPLPAASGAEIEVSIQGGRAFIRMAR